MCSIVEASGWLARTIVAWATWYATSVRQNPDSYLVRVTDAAFRGSNQHIYRLTIHRRPHIDFVLPLSTLPGTQQAVTVFGRNLPGGVDSVVSIDGHPLQKVASTLIAPQDSATLEVAHAIRSTRSDIDGFAWRLPGSNPTQIQFAGSTPVVESEPNNDSATAMTIDAAS